MKKTILILLLLLFSLRIFGQCTNSNDFILSKSTRGLSYITICEYQDKSYFLVKQIRDLNDGTRTRIKKNTPLYILDPSMSIVKLKLDRYVCYDNIDEELSTECYYYYPVTKEILSYLLITPVSGIYLYRDDSVEYLEFNDMTSLYLYKIIRSYFIEHNWRFIGF